MTSRVEAVAEILWHRYSPDHEDSWPSPNADEYRRVASDILSTLTTEPAAPEGRREAVAWADEDMARHWIDRYASGIDAEPQMTRILSCVTRHAEQAVTEAMVEAACRAYNAHLHGKGCPVWEDEHPPMLAALRAAMEAGG